MKNRTDVGRLLRPLSDLTGEPLAGQPLVELCGTDRLLVENHRGLLEYTRELIRVRVCFGEICVLGQEMHLANMTRPQLVICGKIQQVSLCRRSDRC